MNDRWERRDRTDRGGALAFGLLLIIFGALFLASESFNFDWQQYGWPIFIIAPGVVLLVLGLAVPNEAGLGMAIPGGIITAVGLILAFQDATNTYASWSYAWALVAPGSVGASLFLYGLLHRRLDLVDSGLRTAAVGLGLFIGFGLFFENVVGLEEPGSSDVLRNAMPFLAVAMGVIIIAINLLPHHRAEDQRSTTDTWTSGNSTPPSTPPQS